MNVTMTLQVRYWKRFEKSLGLQVQKGSDSSLSRFCRDLVWESLVYDASAGVLQPNKNGFLGGGTKWACIQL